MRPVRRRRRCLRGRQMAASFVCTSKNQSQGKPNRSLNLIILETLEGMVVNVIFEYTFKIKDNILPLQK